MIGAIIGSYIGSQNDRMSPQINQKDFTLLSHLCYVTTDIILILATAKALIDYLNNDNDLSKSIIREYVKAYDNNPTKEWSKNFASWATSVAPKPYNSFGIMAATKIASVGYIANSLEEVWNLSRKITEVTHNHPDGIKGAEAIAVAVFLAKSGMKKEKIRSYISENYYEMNGSLDD